METTRKCERCETVFESKAKARQQRFCSASCRHSAWTEANREKLNANTRDYRARRYEKDGRWRDTGPKSVALAAWIAELKAEPCTDCGGCFPACCMDFDHTGDGVKVNNVGTMVAHHHSRENIEAEIAKCELVCANCHRVRTRDRKTGSGRAAVKWIDEDE